MTPLNYLVVEFTESFSYERQNVRHLKAGFLTKVHQLCLVVWSFHSDTAAKGVLLTSSWPTVL